MKKYILFLIFAVSIASDSFAQSGTDSIVTADGVTRLTSSGSIAPVAVVKNDDNTYSYSLSGTGTDSVVYVGGNLTLTSSGSFAPMQVVNNGNGTYSITVVGGGGSQTPWTSDIDAAGFNLLNVQSLFIGTNPAISASQINWPSAASNAFVDLNGNITSLANSTLWNGTSWYDGAGHQFTDGTSLGSISYGTTIDLTTGHFFINDYPAWDGNYFGNPDQQTGFDMHGSLYVSAAAVFAGGCQIDSSGNLLLNNAYSAGVIVPTGSLIIYDNTGTAYKIPAVAQ